MNTRRPIRSRRKRESGFALLLIALMAGALAISLYIELPRFAQESQRQKEQLLISRGEQYQRAIQMFFKDNKRYPTRIEELESFNNRRYLRKRFVDPMTGKDEWRIIHIQNGVLADSVNIKPPQPGQQGQQSADTYQWGQSAVGGGAGLGQTPTGSGSTGVNLASRRRASDSQAPGPGNGTGAGSGPDGTPLTPQNDPNAQNGGNMPPNNGGTQGYPQSASLPPGVPGMPGAPTGVPGQPNQYPGQTQQYPGQPQQYPGQIQSYPGQVQQYPGQTSQYPGQTSQYPGQVQQNPGQGQLPTPYPGQVPGYPGAPVNSQTGGVSPTPASPYGTQPGANGLPPGYPQPGVNPAQNSNPAQQMIQQILTTPRQQQNQASSSSGGFQYGSGLGSGGTTSGPTAPTGGPAGYPGGVNPQGGNMIYNPGAAGPMQPGLMGTTAGGPGQAQSPGFGTPVSNMPGAAMPGSTIGAGIAGFASTASGDSIMIYGDHHNYKEWEFIFDPMKVKPIPNPLSGANGTPASQMGSMPGTMPGTPVGNSPFGPQGSSPFGSPSGAAASSPFGSPMGQPTAPTGPRQ